MFKRFMIVCWVLFALASFVATGAGIEYKHHEAKKDDILDTATAQGFNVFDVIDPPKVKPGDVLQMERPWDLYQLADDYRAATDESEMFSYIALVAGIIAGTLLLWNVIWHVGHWIWMGREPNN